MKKVLLTMFIANFLSACTSLTEQEQTTLRSLKSQGITVAKPAGNYKPPAHPAVAGTLNILPGVGNFYLALGSGSDGSHCLYGLFNLLTWPTSMFWAIPEAVVDANRINERELVYFYTFDENGKLALKQKDLSITATGLIEPTTVKK